MSTLSSLFNLLDSSSINEIAARLGEPAQAISRGLESSTASLISGLAGRATDSNSMNQIFRLISQAPSDVNVSHLTTAVTGADRASAATSSILDSGKKFMSLAFGSDQSSILDAIGRSTGLRAPSLASLLSIGAPLVMTALGRMVRSDRLSQDQLGKMLVDESSGMQSLLPAGVQRYFQHAPTDAATTDLNVKPLSIRTVPEPRGTQGWLWLIPALLLIPLLLWLFNREHDKQMLRAAAERARSGAIDLGTFVVRTLPGNVVLTIPEAGMESRLLAFIQDPTQSADQVKWFDFDRLLFNTDSAQLRPESQEQLRNIAMILKAYPNVHVKVGGYTDNTGDAQYNLRLSQDRADNVVAELVSLGIASDRLEAQGYGEQYPVADNGSPEGRAKNRRISMRVTQK
jgi:outer membrane protein OmpA-like peptidoglycan-associated protein